jgi:hypothetical protein
MTIMLVLLKDDIYELNRWYGFMWHDTYQVPWCDQFKHLSNAKVITATIWDTVKLALKIEWIYELCQWDGHFEMVVWYA